MGMRKCSDEAASYARGLAHRLSEHGVVVWSGGAVGIDAAAHEGALAVGGITVAVVATGLDECYPPEHARLYDRIVRAGGAIVSAFDPSEKANPAAFHYRNGVLAALTEATVVVQAQVRSGALSTAARARRLNRPLFVVPAAPWDERGGGNLIEIGRGARMLTSDAALFSFFGIADGGRAEKNDRNERADDLSVACEKVLLLTAIAPACLDDLCALSGLAAPLVQEALLTLTLRAVLVEGPSGWYRRTSS